ncbi:MAG: V-type ATP synthase subunit I [Methanomassiliicoccales archaeon]
MNRILITGSRNSLKDTVDSLYASESLHLIDFPADDLNGFKLGNPLPSASSASHRLLKIRALAKDLEIDPSAMEIEAYDTYKVDSEYDSTVAEIEVALASVLEVKNQAQTAMSDLEAERKALEPFESIDLPLELYRGYSSLTVFTGYVKSDVQASLGGLKAYDLQKSADGRFITLFVAKAEAAEAQKILAQIGFTESPAPVATGTPSVRLKAIEVEKTANGKKLEESTAKVAELCTKYAPFLVACDEQYSIVVEMAEVPLRVGVTDHSFVMDGWVPVSGMAAVEKELKARVGDKVHFEVLETKTRKEVHPHDAHPKAKKKKKKQVEAAAPEVHEEHVAHVAPEAEVAPSKISHGKTVGKFQYLVELVSIPKYQEVDPAFIVAITFPLFFGLMVGDIGYAIPFVILGALGLKKCTTKEWRTISTMLFFGGLWATLFGFVLFGEAFGLHFAARWTTGASHIIYPYGNEMTWASLLQVNVPHSIGPIPLGVYSKLGSVKILLFIAVLIGFAHLFMGLCVGFYNKKIRYGMKHAVLEKGSWMLILVGGLFLLLWIVNTLLAPGLLTDSVAQLCMIMGLVLLLPGIVLLLIGEGGTGLVELPGLMSNIVSYTRLAAIGMSKAGLALAFNTIAFVTIAGWSETTASFTGDVGIVMIIAMCLIFMVGHLTIFILAIMSAGIHGIRLHYVELFGKFYEGGGLKFNPLRVVRKYTKEKTGE